MEYEWEAKHPFYVTFGRGPEMFQNKDVLDLGSGFGGHTVAYAECGARSVVGIEISEQMVEYATRFARDHGAENVSFRVGTGEHMPSDGEQFDLVVMSDVMEHVISPRDVLHECYRILRPGGRLALIFPPYYDVISGSHMHGRVTIVPGLHLLFPTQVLKSAMIRRLEEQGIDYTPYFREVPTDKMWNLNGLTVRKFNQLIDETDFQVEMLHYRPHLRKKNKLIALPLAVLANTPIVQEAFCSRIVAILRK